MTDSVDDLGGGFEEDPPDSWEVADIDATMSRLMLSSKRESDNTSPNLTSASSLSEFTSASSAPARSSSGGVLEDTVNSVDQFLREAVQNPRERLSVLRLEQEVEKFIRDPSQQQMEFQQLPTSYLRLAAHRLAHHYSLHSMVSPDNNLPDGSGSKIIIQKTSESHLPLIRLADIPIKPSTHNSTTNVVKVAIKQRPNKTSQISCGPNSNSPRSNSLKSVEERKEEYNRARARIFCFNASSSLEEDMDNVRSISNSRVAILRDHEVERKDPDYDRSYDRYTQRFDPGFGFNVGSYLVQPMYTPVLNYNTEFPQLGSTHRAPSEHQPQWVAPSLPSYRPSESMVTPFNHGHGVYMQYPSQQPEMTFIHPHEHAHQQLAQTQQQQFDEGFGLGRPR
ncbi:unnamed protein product [Lactuca virosa]|uniref:R3H domain-containing protein n=1 Tax=Lactuca virosa TaxID=75947 RepID=A0AAU9P8G4_9ASTR|nr:unnamed protein product [Lactuca virosa]